jgi:hypothetical protein
LLFLSPVAATHRYRARLTRPCVALGSSAGVQSVDDASASKRVACSLSSEMSNCCQAEPGADRGHFDLQNVPSGWLRFRGASSTLLCQWSFSTYFDFALGLSFSPFAKRAHSPPLSCLLFFCCGGRRCFTRCCTFLHSLTVPTCCRVPVATCSFANRLDCRVAHAGQHFARSARESRARYCAFRAFFGSPSCFLSGFPCLLPDLVLGWHECAFAVPVVLLSLTQTVLSR